MATKAQETAVRTYLQALKDPELLRDDKAISDLQKRLEASNDPLERVRLRAQLDQAERVEASAYEDGFVQHARAWAQEHGVSAESFQAEGVSEEVLARAGFDGTRRRRRRASGGGRRQRVSRDDVRHAIRQHNHFTLPQIQTKTGASRETVRGVIKELLDGGEIERAGTDQAHKGRGRAPTAYQRA